MSEGKSIKILVVGSEGSGKGLLLPKIAATVGNVGEVGIHFFQMSLDGQSLQFWEWVGADNPRSPKPGFYDGANAACVVYDVRSLHSFEQAKVWIRVIQTDFKIDSVLLLANYCDDVENRVILPQDGRFVVGTRNFLYFEVDPTKVAEILECIRILVQSIPIIASH